MVVLFFVFFWGCKAEVLFVLRYLLGVLRCWFGSLLFGGGSRREWWV